MMNIEVLVNNSPLENLFLYAAKPFDEQVLQYHNQPA